MSASANIFTSGALPARHAAGIRGGDIVGMVEGRSEGISELERGRDRRDGHPCGVGSAPGNCDLL